jgi:hypothetical protein
MYRYFLQSSTDCTRIDTGRHTDIDAVKKDLNRLCMWTSANVRVATEEGPGATVHSVITPAWAKDVRVDTCTVFIRIETGIVRVATMITPC